MQNIFELNLVLYTRKFVDVEFNMVILNTLLMHVQLIFHMYNYISKEHVLV